MSDNSTSPDAPTGEALSFALRDAFLNAILVEVFVAGLYTMLFGYTVALMCSRPKLLRSNVVFMSFITILYVFIMLHVCLQWLVTRQIWISNGATEGTTFNYLATQPLWIHESSSVFNTGSTLIADGIMIWRTWVIWNRSWKATVVPILAWIATFICSIFALIELTKPLTEDVTANPSTIYLGLSLATTVICTTMIVIRILRLNPYYGDSPYRHIIEIICESAALYSLTLIIFLPMYSSRNIAVNFPSEYLKRIVLGITGIAPTLIVARIASGVGRSNEAWSHATTTSSFSFRISRSSRVGDTDLGAAGSNAQVDSGLVVNREVEKYLGDNMFMTSQV